MLSCFTQNITLMLVVVVFMFVICELPDLALRIAFTIQEFVPSVEIDIWTLRYINALTNTMLTLNSSINFLIYCLVGKKFRQIFLRLYCCRGGSGADARFGRGSEMSVRPTTRRCNGVLELTENEPIINKTLIFANSRIVAMDSTINEVVEL